MLTYKGYIVETVTIDYSGRDPEVTISFKKSGKRDKIKWVSFVQSALTTVEREIKAIIDDHIDYSKD